MEMSPTNDFSYRDIPRCATAGKRSSNSTLELLLDLVQSIMFLSCSARRGHYRRLLPKNKINAKNDS